MSEITKILDAQKKGILAFGIKRSIKLLKSGDVTAVFLAANCPVEAERQVRAAAQLVSTAVTRLEQRNEELGTVCKKPFSVTVLSILKKKEE